MTIFLYGSGQYELRRNVAQMTAAYIKKNGSDMGIERVDGSVAKFDQLAGDLAAVPFLASSRLVIIDDVLTNKVVAEKIADLLALIPKTTVALFVERTVDGRTSAFKTLKTADKVVKFDPVTGPKLVNWIKAEVQMLGGTIDHTVAKMLADRAKEDQWRLVGEIAKLVTYDPTVTAETVEQLVAPTIERTVFELIEAVAVGRVAVAMEALEALRAARESDVYVLNMIQWQLRNLLLVKLAPPAMSPADVAQATGINSFVASKAAAIVVRLPEAGLKRAFTESVAAEYLIKSGSRPADVAVELLIIKIAELVKPAQ
ncbi:DNA polymerase III subunit delta [bacterium]|nr:MAG: DNA polymerase III subunit delta [bacterium]